MARTSDQQIILSYSCERDHAPKEHGTMTFDLKGETWLIAHADERVRRLADSYLQSYRARQASTLIE